MQHYNGSSPYKAPATLNVIPHYEFGIGAFFPKKGIRSIAKSLFLKAQELGVHFNFNEKVKSIAKSKNTYTINQKYKADIVICNMDVASAARGPLKTFLPKSRKSYEPSSSALIFYWGMNREFSELDVHNIFFSKNYKAEFEAIFERKEFAEDLTVYVHISSKVNSKDAPPNKENWFVMVNSPYLSGQDWNQLIEQTRNKIVKKINKCLHADIEQCIEVEHKLTPSLIYEKTSSYKGALYGSSSNNRMAAFLRQPNFSKHRGLYFCGGSVHPGGGIPLCLLSAKIATE